MSETIARRESVGSRASRHVMARHPWRWFFAVALIPTVVVALPGSLSSVDAVNVDAFALLAAMLVAWAGDEGEKAASRSGLRTAVFLAALAVWALTWWRLGVGSGNLVSDLVPALPAALIVAAALAAIFSPSAALRDLVRPLLVLRASRRAYLLPLLAWPLLGGLAILLSHTGSGHAAWGGVGLSLKLDILRGTFAGAVFTAIAAAIAWYGFAARRLLRRLSPLLTALIVGPTLWLAVFLTLSIALRSSPVNATVLLVLLEAFAVAIVAVWAYQRSRGSLVPVLLFLIESNVTLTLVWLWSGPRFNNGDQPSYLMVALNGLLALAFVAQGRMWRRPDQAPAVPPEELLGAAAAAERAGA